jgi:hypothetical protein
MRLKLRTAVITRAFVGGCALLHTAACIDTPDFADRSIVDRARVLAIVAEPPEVNPGQQAQLSLLIAEAPEYSVTWHACGVFDSFGGSQYGENLEDEGCGGGLAVALGEGDRAQLLPELTQRLFLDLDLAVAILGAELPEETIANIRTRVGLAFLVEATVEMPERQIRAVKRVLISENASPHSNPPPPHFWLGEAEVVADPETEFVCHAVDDDRLAVPADSEIELAPVVEEGEDEPWIERYQVIDARGELGGREEKAFYSWFSTAGHFSEGITKAPLRNEIWRTPEDPGCYPLWLVVRDGHGGTSACRAQVAVGGHVCE